MRDAKKATFRGVIERLDERGAALMSRDYRHAAAEIGSLRNEFSDMLFLVDEEED